MMAQVTAAALASECKVLSHPASVDTIPTDGSKEDVVPMAMGAAVKLRRVVRNVRHVLGDRADVRGAGYRLPPAAAIQCAPSRTRVRASARACPAAGSRSRACPATSPRSPTPIERGAFTELAMAERMSATHSDRRRRRLPSARPTARSSARRAAARCQLQGMAAGSGAAHADEQPRSRGRRAAGRSRRLRRHRDGRRASWEAFDAIVAHAAHPRARRNAARAERQARRACSARTRSAPRVLIANSNLVGRWATWDVLPRARAARG